MGKRLPCPRCQTVSEYDVPANEASAPQREVRCRSCGHRFGYGFRPEYVTEADPEPKQDRAADAPFDLAAEAIAARERLTKYAMRYPDYHDRDRDILLLSLLADVERVDGELASLKRSVDVFAKRCQRP